jgi:hypothetical protein
MRLRTPRPPQKYAWHCARQESRFADAILQSVEQRYAHKEAYATAEAYVFRGDLDSAFR